MSRVGSIVGVMVRGQWMEEPELSTMLAEVASSFDPSPFQDLPPLAGPGQREFEATYRITWKGVPLGAERIWVGRSAEGRRTVLAQVFDPHAGQRVSIQLNAGATGAGDRLRIDSDGATGRGYAELARTGAVASMRAQLLSGVETERVDPLQPQVLLGAQGLLAGRLLILPTLGVLQIGQESQVVESELALGSAADLTTSTWRIVRLADGPSRDRGPVLRRNEIRPDKGPGSTLTLDESGWPFAWEFTAFGEVVRYERSL